MEKDSNGVGQVERGVSAGAVQGDDLLTDTQFLVAQAPILPTEDKSHLGAVGRAFPLQRSAKPGEGIVRIAEWDLSMVQAATGPDSPSAIIHRLLQLLKASAVLEVVGPVDRHAPGLLAAGIHLRIDQTEFGDIEIGAESGDAADVERP